MLALRALVLLVFLAGCHPPSLEAQLRQRIRYGGEAERVTVAFADLKTGERVGIDEHESMHAGSTMKLPVMMEVYRRAAAHELNLDQPIHVANKFRSIVDNSEFTLDPNEDGDSWMYANLDRDVPLKKAIERMIVRSSNLATNLIIELVGADRVTALCRALGAAEIMVRRGVEDGKAFKAGLINTASAHDLALLLETLYHRRAQGADEMIAVLEGQELNEGIPQGVPANLKVAHKTGWLTGFYHDAALVDARGPHPYVLVVMTHGKDEKRAPSLVADLSRIVYRHVSEARR
jgi:beta-lactamase class A